jgi:hypothetical protein
MDVRVDDTDDEGGGGAPSIRWSVVASCAAVGVAAVALAGPGLFLIQSWRSGGDWYTGYFEMQLLASIVLMRLAPSVEEAAAEGRTAVLTRDDAPGWACSEAKGAWRWCVR